MFERFTPRARRVIVLAQDAARDMGHSHIQPEHLLLGLQRGDGMAANAMAQAGVDEGTLRERVAALYDAKSSAKKINKVPFSPGAKKCLEQSLRAAMGLGHNYIGTEHLFFGVERQAEGDERSLDDLLGVGAVEIHRRLTDMLGAAASGAPTRSPALQAALERGRTGAGQSPMTTGHLLAGMLADPDSQVSHAIAAIGVDPQRLAGALESVNLAETSDASPAPQNIAITIGETTVVIADPEVALAVQHLTANELHGILKKAIDHQNPGRATG